MTLFYKKIPIAIIAVKDNPLWYIFLFEFFSKIIIFKVSLYNTRIYYESATTIVDKLILITTCIFFGMNTLTNYKKKQDDELLVAILSYITHTTYFLMLYLSQIQIYYARLCLWLFTVPLQFQIIGKILQTNMSYYVMYFEVSVLLKMASDVCSFLDTNFINFIILITGMVSIFKLMLANTISQIKYTTFIIWCGYAILHILYNYYNLDITYLNTCHSVLDLCMKMFLTTYIIQYNDTIYSLHSSDTNLDDYRTIVKMHTIIQNTENKNSKIMNYIYQILSNILSNSHTNLHIKNNILNTVFFGDSFKQLITTGSYSKHYDCAGVLFIDIMNYTEMCKDMPTSEITHIMNLIYTKYDELLREYPMLHKIETIGDAYMVISGVHDLKKLQLEMNPHESLYLLIQFAIKLISERSTINRMIQMKTELNIRIGISCGAVSISIVGLDVPRCCFFGHTINLASRIQSASRPNGISVSKEVYTILTNDTVKPHIHFSEECMVELKGIGNTSVYHILSYH